MKKTRILSFVLCALMVVALAAVVSCEKKEDENTLGSGSTSFTLEITDDKGELKTYTVKTDEKTVGDALVKAGVTADAGYIETLNGLTAVWDDETSIYNYWAFYIGGEMASVGAFEAEVTKDAVYAFVFTDGNNEVWE